MKSKVIKYKVYKVKILIISGFSFCHSRESGNPVRYHYYGYHLLLFITDPDFDRDKQLSPRTPFGGFEYFKSFEHKICS